jgi:hypothetical protein
MTIKKKSGRQEVVSAEIEFMGTDVVGTTFNGAIELPGGARVVSAEFQVIEAAQAAVTVDVGDSVDPDRYGAAVNAVTLARTALTPTGFVTTTEGDVGVTFSAQPTQGKFRLSLQYVVAGRVAFSQGLDYRADGVRGA